MVFNNKYETLEFEYKFYINDNQRYNRTRIGVQIKCEKYDLYNDKVLNTCNSENKRHLYKCLKEVDEMDMSFLYDLAKKMFEDYKLKKECETGIEFMIKKIEDKNGKFEITVDR